MERRSRRDPAAKDRRRAHVSVPSHAVTRGAYAVFEVGASRDVIEYGADGFSLVRVVECRAPAIGDLPPEAVAKLRVEFESGHVRYEIEQYDAKHGYAVDDSDVYDRAAAERHYAALTRLYGETLRT